MKKTPEPVISIILPVYNCSQWISEAIDSILAQSFHSWELIIANDGSTDDSLEIIMQFNDSRIKVKTYPHNFISTLNRGFNEAKGKYIARMDADDIMHPDRLKVQFSLMEKHPEIDILGSWVQVFGCNTKNQVIGTLYGQINNPLLKLLRSNILFHPTVMLRRSFWIEKQLQYEAYPHAEDYKLWVDAAIKGATFYIESQPLLNYRISEQQISTTNRDTQKETADNIRSMIALQLIQLDKDSSLLSELLSIHQTLIENHRISKMESINFFTNLLEKNCC